MSQLNFDDLFSVFQGEPSTVGAVVASEPAKKSAPKKMITSDNARREFIRVFGLTARYLRRWDVFCDFITLVASELDIATVRTADNIERSRKICARYEAADLENLHTLFGMLVCALQGKYQDFLGSVFMELDLGSDDMGQFFTPYSVQSLMAQMLIPGTAETVSKEGWVSFSEPCCGAAGMVVAYAECMLKAGFNPSDQMFAYCIDIDPVAADMAFIQLSLLGIPAEVVTGNTLTMKFSRVRYTPVYYIDNWEARFALRDKYKAMKQVLAMLGV